MAEKAITYPYAIDVNRLDNPSPAESRQYEGQSVLGVGFTRRTGLGYVIGVGYARRGAEIIIGGSSEGSVQLALGNYKKREGIDPNVLSGFPADLRDSAQIDAAVARLKKPPSIVDYASATGMEGFFLQMSDALQEMRVIRDEGESNAEDRIADKKGELRKNLAIWVPEHYDDALAVNRTAPEYLIGRLVDRFSEPFKFVYHNSSFGFKGEGPIHYANVYRTKHQMSVWMTDNAERLARLGVTMNEETDPVIGDGDVGISILEEISPFWSLKIQKVMDETQVERQEVFGSVKLLTDMFPGQRSIRPNPNRHFLVRRSGIAVVLDHFPEELEIDSKEFDF